MNVCLERLLELKAPSRLGQKDASLFSFAPGIEQYASAALGWTTLASEPPMPIEQINSMASWVRSEGLEAVILIGQGGSSQASMTLTKLHEVHGERMLDDIAFRTMDSLSPVFVNHILGSSDPYRTIYIVSSKSGSTIEPLMLEKVAWQYAKAHLGEQGAAKRFVALTDPGSGLEKMAREKGYRYVINTPPDVGGRYSALTAFGLFPAALTGIDIAQGMAFATDSELACRLDNSENPALQLACFLYSAYCNGRDKFSLVMPSSGQVFGLWIEQLVAESLGKHGKGILPNVEVDASILSVPRDDRSVISYEVGRAEGFIESLNNIDPSIPHASFTLNSVSEVFSRFVVWEYAVAFLGILLEVNPFDQPDVEITKQLVRQHLSSPADQQQPDAGFLELEFTDGGPVRSMRLSKALLGPDVDVSEGIGIDAALRLLLGSISRSDYFSINAFLPFRGYGRREALERMRNRVASRIGVASCLEIGPRYLHSTGQLHKGGPNTGVFLLLSADEDNDIAVPGEGFTLGKLAATQALCDFQALAARDRRAVQIHLRGNDSETLSLFADRLCTAVSAVKVQ
jgi:glucose-6-phosphate isomerase